ncbi:MAG: adenylosuccinate lyase, partial [Cyanobacteriota bacterium]
LVQRHAHAAWNTEGGDFRANLEADPVVMGHLSPERLAACFASEPHRAQLEVIFQRLGL